MNRRGFIGTAIGAVSALVCRVASPVVAADDTYGGFIVPEKYARCIEEMRIGYGEMREVTMAGDRNRRFIR